MKNFKSIVFAASLLAAALPAKASVKAYWCASSTGSEGRIEADSDEHAKKQCHDRWEKQIAAGQVKLLTLKETDPQGNPDSSKPIMFIVGSAADLEAQQAAKKARHAQQLDQHMQAITGIHTAIKAEEKSLFDSVDRIKAQLDKIHHIRVAGADPGKLWDLVRRLEGRIVEEANDIVKEVETLFKGLEQPKPNIDAIEQRIKADVAAHEKHLIEARGFSPEEAMKHAAKLEAHIRASLGQ